MRLLKGDELLFQLLCCSGYIGAKLGVTVAGTFTLLLYRFIMVTLVVAVIIAVRREWRPPDRDTLFANFVWLVAILKAFEFGLNVGLAALIVALQPALTALVSPFLLGEMNDRLRLCGIGVGFAGVLVFVASDMHLSGAARLVV